MLVHPVSHLNVSVLGIDVPSEFCGLLSVVGVVDLALSNVTVIYLSVEDVTRRVVLCRCLICATRTFA